MLYRLAGPYWQEIGDKCVAPVQNFDRRTQPFGILGFAQRKRGKRKEISEQPTTALPDCPIKLPRPELVRAVLRISEQDGPAKGRKELNAGSSHRRGKKQDNFRLGRSCGV